MKLPPLKLILKILMAIFYSTAGVNHFLNTPIYLKIMPSYLPYPHALVYISGIAETLLGILILFPKFTKIAAWGIIALLIAVFPANIHMALHPKLFPQIPTILLWLRLPVQALLIGWAYWFTK